MVKGECNCGKAAYQIDEKLSDVYICHCSICRRSTGSGGIAVVIVPKEKFTWVKGKELVKYWAKPGREWHTNFCSVCGSSLPGENDSENMYIPVGTLTSGHENLSVSHHLWVGSKASWEEIADSGKQRLEGFSS